MLKAAALAFVLLRRRARAVEVAASSEENEPWTALSGLWTDRWVVKEGGGEPEVAIVAPPAFSCPESAGFSPHWGAFRDGLGLLRFSHEALGRDPDNETAAHDLALMLLKLPDIAGELWRLWADQVTSGKVMNDVYKAVFSCSHKPSNSFCNAFEDLGSGFENRRSCTFWEQDICSADVMKQALYSFQEKGFCFYGFFDAMIWLRDYGRFSRLAADDKVYRTASDPELSDYLLDLEASILGDEFELVAWGISGWSSGVDDAFNRGLSVLEPTKVPRAFQLAREAYVRYWDYTLHSGDPEGPMSSRAAVPSPVLVVAVFGYHISLSLELAASAAMALRGEIAFCFGGQYYPSSSVQRLEPYGSLCTGPSQHIADIYKTFMDDFLDKPREWEETSVALLEELTLVFKEVIAVGTGEAAEYPWDAVICSAPAPLCWPLAILGNTGTAPTPVLLQLDDGLDMVPEAFASGLVGSLRHILMQPPGVGVFTGFTASPVIAGLVEQVTGVPLEVVPHRCEAARAHPYDPQKAPSSKRLLVLRTDNWLASLQGIGFLMMLKHLEVWNEGFFRNHFEPNVMWDKQEWVVGHAMSGWWQQATKEFKAALFMPDDIMKMIFYETYARGMPIFAPSRGHLAQTAQRFAYYHFDPRLRIVTDHWASTEAVPYEPFRSHDGVHGAGRSLYAPVGSCTSSSQLSTNFGCDCLFDGMEEDPSVSPRGAWLVEGDGVGDWVRFEFQEAVTINSVELVHVSRPGLRGRCGKTPRSTGHGAEDKLEAEDLAAQELCSGPSGTTACLPGFERLRLDFEGPEAAFDEGTPHVELKFTRQSTTFVPEPGSADSFENAIWEPYQNRELAKPVRVTAIRVTILESFQGFQGTTNGLHELRFRLFQRKKEGFGFRTAPQGAMGLDQARYWMGLTDVLNYPHVIHFDSLPALLIGFVNLDAAEVHKKMLKFHDELRAKNERFFRRALHELLLKK
ncbi:unnamed protein product [Polarella glacialis]|uniref:Uncharacterized protein n=1 Tax=Polarella glacialis TaxID=89957 RepID=A0A813KHK6_POLGL|nr:unnamed protein product [Polarella glacialis]CAE8703403.1 unnamed protein product [Polarella glacialis]